MSGLSPLSVLVALGGALVYGPLPAATQDTRTEAVRRDSVEANRAARREQARFEVVRRNHLPWGWGGGSGPCDERIGRFCLTHSDDEGEDWVPPPEDEATIRARDRLLDRLAELGGRFPGDAWIAGQRVRYLVEARRMGEARHAAEECRAQGWWCSALAGYAAHHAGAAAAADSAFDGMIAGMSEEERDRWLDLSRLVEPTTARRFRRLRGAEREAFRDRFWSLADPFFTRPGNEIRSEHLARNLMDELQDRAKSTENLSWGDDLREIVLRYGWPIGWERVRQSGLVRDAPSLISHYANSEQQLLPPAPLFLDTASIAAGEWDEDSSAALVGYALPLGDSTARWLYPLDHQFATFRRGDSLRVVAAYSLPEDSLPRGAPLRAGLALTRDGVRMDAVALEEEAPLRGVVQATVAPGPLLASLEILADSTHHAARARTGLTREPWAPRSFALSDLLLLSAAPTTPTTLDEAAPLALGSTAVRPDQEIGVYWELYGLDAAAPDTLTMSLRLVEERRGLLRRIGERIGVVREIDPIRMGWTERGGVDGYAGRALFLRIPSLRPGSYRIELEATRPGAEPLVATQRIEVGGE